MEEVIEPGCRATLRVLIEHLQDPSTWEKPEQIRAINAGNFRGLLPLSKLSHQIIAAGHNLTGDENSARNLIVYQHSVTMGLPSLWRELRRDPWRGLVTQPITKQEWWLTHAGIRREGDRSNVYELTDAANKSELLKFYPTQDDEDLLKIERSGLAQNKWKSSCLIALVDEIAAVSSSAPASSSRTLPENPAHPGAQLDFEVMLDRFDEDPAVPASEVPAEVFVGIRIHQWSDEVVRAAIVPLLMGFIDPAQENWAAHSSAGKTITYSALISESRLAQLVAAASLPHDLSSARSLTSNAPATSHAHYVSRDPLVDAFISGTELQACAGAGSFQQKTTQQCRCAPKVSAFTQRIPNAPLTTLEYAPSRNSCGYCGSSA